MKTQKAKLPTTALSFLAYSSTSYKRVVFLAVLAAVSASLVSSLIPYIFKRLVDAIAGVSSFGAREALTWALIYVVCGFLKDMLWRSSGFAGMRWSTRAAANARSFLMSYVTKHSHNYFINRFAGGINTKIKSASDGVSSMANWILWGWLSFAVHLVTSMFLVFITHAKVGYIFIAWIVLVVPINLYLAKKKLKLSVEAQKRETELNGQSIDTLTNINAVYDYSRRSFEIGNLDKSIDIRRLARLKSWSFSEKSKLLNNVLETLFTAGIIFTTISLWGQSVVTAGDIVLILTLIVAIRSDISRIGDQINDFSELVGQVKEGLDDILKDHEVVDVPGSKALSVSKGEIVFDGVSFGYGEKKIFDSLNLKIEAGERVGLVGKSGSGKSTLMKILTRNYDLKEGRILIDGQDIAQVSQESLRDSISIVPQEPLLFHRTLRENIIYGHLSATDEEISTAAAHAQAHNFIETLPQKYETLVGERGVKLSGGERQRVAIARAFLKNSKMLLLDEATSSLDSESEILIQKALSELMEGKTVIAIAHRLSTLRAMDRIIVLDGGKIIEDGSHDQLLKNGGTYAELWAHQAGGFLKEE